MADDLFRSTAAYYARYRPGYPPELIAHVVARCGLDGAGRTLDLGCGTGQLALPLAAHVAEVVGLDPSPEMLAEARRAARAAGVANARWLLGSDRDLPALAAELAPLRLAVAGRSFHWMDGDATLRALDRLLEPAGAVVLLGDVFDLWDGREPWQQVVTTTVRRWLGERRRAGSGVYTRVHEPWEDQLARSAFRQVERWQLAVERQWEVDAVVGLTLSTSFASPAILGAQREPFEQALRAALRACEAEHGAFREHTFFDVLLARRA